MFRRARRSTREAPYTRARTTAAISTTCQATDQTVAQTVFVTWATTWWAAVLAELAAEDTAAAGCPPVAVAAFQPRRKARMAQTAVTGPAYLGVSLTVIRCALIEPVGSPPAAHAGPLAAVVRGIDDDKKKEYEVLRRRLGGYDHYDGKISPGRYFDRDQLFATDPDLAAVLLDRRAIRPAG
jgi:hypothetical protein